MSGRFLKTLMFGLGVSVTLSTSALAQEKLPLKLGIGPAAIGQIAYWVGVYNGFFEKNGLDVTLVTAASGADYSAALLSGNMDIGTIDIPGVINANKAGADFKIVASIYDYPSAMILCREDVAGVVKGWPEGMKSLEGKTVGITGPNSGGETLVRYSVTTAGADMSKVTLIAAGNPAGYIAAYNAGQVDCFMAYQPTPTLLKQQGHNYTVVMDLSKGEGPPLLRQATGNIANATSEWSAKNSETIKRFRAGLTDSMAFIKDPANAEAIAKAIEPGFKGIEPAVLLELVKSTTTIFDRAPTITEQQFDAFLEIYSSAYAQPKPEVTFGQLWVD